MLRKAKTLIKSGSPPFLFPYCSAIFPIGYKIISLFTLLTGRDHNEEHFLGILHWVCRWCRVKTSRHPQRLWICLNFGAPSRATRASSFNCFIERLTAAGLFPMPDRMSIPLIPPWTVASLTHQNAIGHGRIVWQLMQYLVVRLYMTDESLMADVVKASFYIAFVRRY